MQLVTLRPIELRDWQRVHEWAATEAACRFQPWGPNRPEDSERFVADALVLGRKSRSADEFGRRRQMDRVSWAWVS
jgi:hypothetical protein